MSRSQTQNDESYDIRVVAISGVTTEGWDKLSENEASKPGAEAYVMVTSRYLFYGYVVKNNKIYTATTSSRTSGEWVTSWSTLKDEDIRGAIVHTVRSKLGIEI